MFVRLKKALAAQNRISCHCGAVNTNIYARHVTMFRKACDIHKNVTTSQITATGKSRALQMSSVHQANLKEYQNAPPHSNRPLSSQRPLSAGNPKTQKPLSPDRCRESHLASSHNSIKISGVKRTSSGLTKAVATQDGFDHPALPFGGPGRLAMTIDDSAVSKGDDQNRPPSVFYEPDDFDSDIDLDLELPTAKGFISHPKAPPKRLPLSSSSTSKMNDADRMYRISSGLDLECAVPVEQTAASSVEDKSSIDFNNLPETVSDGKKSDLRLLNSSEPIPWSSSPVEHYKTPPKVKIADLRPRVRETQKAKPRPSKKRTLPWLDTNEGKLKDSVEPTRRTFHSGSVGEGFKDHNSPAISQPSQNGKTINPFDAFASEVKDQQKKLREANRKVNKTRTKTIDLTKKQRQKRFSTKCAVCLSGEQENVLNMVVEKHKSVFFTGSAGTGKSVLLREIIAALKKKYLREPDRVAVTASTGLAACNIGGVTLHSFAGIGLGKETAEDLIRKIKKNQKAKHRWMRTKVLVIDEVSMIDAELFDKLEQVARTLRNNGRPFGGIQIVITGDFFQLPPVVENSRVSRFCFDAGTWNTTIEHTIGLHHVFRQKDPTFAAMLNEMREGRMSEASISAFKRLDREMDFDDDIEATELFPTRAEVDRANHMRMARLTEVPVRVFTAKDGGTLQDFKIRDKILQNCMAPEIIQLKKGAQVMLIKNIDESLVNGTIGKVVGFASEQTYAYMGENEDDITAIQEADSQELNPAEQKLKEKLNREKDEDALPVVKFNLADGSTRQILCPRESWKNELPNGEVQASRSQVPLILAWALSIHKAQGQTLERVKVDLGKVFEKGQAYVALSRATSMRGLQVLRFDPKKVMAHDRVRNFYRKLESARQSAPEAKSTEGDHEQDEAFRGGINVF